MPLEGLAEKRRKNKNALPKWRRSTDATMFKIRAAFANSPFYWRLAFWDGSLRKQFDARPADASRGGSIWPICGGCGFSTQ